MKVYIVTAGTYDDYCIHGAYSNKTNAINKAKNFIKDEPWYNVVRVEFWEGEDCDVIYKEELR